MKLAVLLFGHMRTFDFCADFLMENIVNKYNADVFIHTWDELDSSTQNWENRISSYCKLDDRIKKQIQSLYKPKKILIEHQNTSNDEIVTSKDNSKKVSLSGMKYMFNSLNSANKLRKEYENENNIKYDIILCTRPDILIYNPLRIEEILSEAKDTGLDVNKCRFFSSLSGANSSTNVRLNINRVNDILFFGVPEVIDKYINANCTLNKTDVDGKFINVVQVYTRNEISNGILPVSFCFDLSYDWLIYRNKSKNEIIHYLNEVNADFQIKHLLDTLKNKKIVVVGAGQLFWHINKKYDLSSLNIVGISNHNYSINLNSKFIFGYKKIPYVQLPYLDVDVVLVASRNYSQTIDDLTDFEFEKRPDIIIKPLITNAI